MLRFGEPTKIEQVTGVRFPDYHIVEYGETPFPGDVLQRRVCRVNAEFDDVPSDTFYRQLDSLCVNDTVHWHKGSGAYAYDSIYGKKQISKLVLAVVLEKGKKDFEIRYDDCVEFEIKTK